MNEVTTPVEEELAHLEILIRKLKQQYDIFFSGAAPRQPFETRKEVDLMVKRLGDTPMQRFADRYRYNSLAGKFQTYCELWAKILRQREEGIRSGARAAPPPPPPPSTPAKETSGSEVFFRTRFKDPTSEDDNFKTFYDKYQDARKTTGNGGKSLTYSAFLRQIAQKTEALKARSGCAAVVYSIVVKDGAVTLKAAPVKEKGR
jgi:hypothetical protein